MYLSYLPNLRAQFSFYAAKCYNFKECVSLYVQGEATAVLYYCIIVHTLQEHQCAHLDRSKILQIV